MEGEKIELPPQQLLDINSSFSDSNDFGAVQLKELEQESKNSFVVDAEWDPVQFNLNKSSNPSWSGKARRKSSSSKRPSKPRRIQDIRLQRLDSDESLSNSSKKSTEQKDTKKDDGVGGVFDDNSWPYEDENEAGSPCALFGKLKMTSSPSKQFAKSGEFSRGDPEWENGASRGSSRKSGHSSESRKKTSSSSSRRSRPREQRKEKAKKAQEAENDDDGSISLGSFDGSDNRSQSEDGSEHFSDSDKSVTDSPNYDDEDLMVTPAMGKQRATRKKPPTLKRGAHGVQTPSVVKALKGKQAFSSDDEDDNENIDFGEFDTDNESTPLRKSKDSKAKRDGRLDAANASFRRASLTRKASKKFAFDRSMSSADMKAARRANSSFKGQMEMNKSFSALESKRRAQRKEKQKDMHGSFSGTGHSQTIKSFPSDKSRSARKGPTRAKSLGNPTAGGSKLKSALSKFAGSGDEPAPEDKPKPSGKNYGATLSALKVLSGSTHDGGDKAGDKEADLKTSIMQQVYRSSSLNPVAQIKQKPKPKIQKSLSLSASGMTRVAAANGGILEGKQAKEAPPRVRRNKTANERAQASLSDFNGSYHESMAKMRRSKMADASERSSHSALSAQSAVSQSSKGSEISKEPPAPKPRPSNLDRKHKSFSHPARPSTSLDAEIEEEPASPEQEPVRPKLKRGSSKRLQSPGKSPGSSSGGGSRRGGLSKSGSRRGLSKSGSVRKIRPEYDANPQKPSGTNVIALLKTQEPVTEKEILQKGNRQMFHALMFKTRMGIDMEKLQRKVDGIVDDEDEEEEDGEGSHSHHDEEGESDDDPESDFFKD